MADTGATITAGTGCTPVDAHHATCPAAGIAFLTAFLDDWNYSATADVAVPSAALGRGWE